VDIFVPLKDEYRVIIDSETGLALTAMLNQTNLAMNNNKFFLIQALERIDGRGFSCWRRWGRVGYPGQTEMKEVTSSEEAVDLFKEKFEAKTLNAWSKHIFRQFKPHSGKYTLLAVDTLTQAVGDLEGHREVEVIKYEETKLEQQIYNLIKMISSREMFERELRIAGLDLTKMPLGKISEKMISEGYKVLKQIEKELLSGHGRREFLNELSGKFFTVIPHNFGFNKAISFAINSFEKLREKVEVLESLRDVANSLSNEATIQQSIRLHRNPIDDQYSRLLHQLELLSPSSSDYRLIRKYKENTQGGTHLVPTSIVNIFKIRESKPNAFIDDSNKMLLWHGSRLTNWMSILGSGLKIAPSEALHTGFMFAKGIYTADCFSKSANYCFHREQRGQRKGIVVLCEVSLGKMNELMDADYDADKKLATTGCQSTKGVGKYFPDPAEVEQIDDVKVPCGKLIQAGEEQRTSRRRSNGSLMYNEFVVYDTNRVRMKYLVEVEFH
jgi:poly [ADP-ribose] polymerase